jgi:acyl carrier protein
MTMNEAEVLLDLRQHVAMLLERPVEQIGAERPLHELGLDSMGFVDLLVFIEKRFGLPLMSSRLAQDDFATLSRLTRRILQAVPQ